MESVSPTVFVVDDDPSVCKALSRLLRTAGWTVRSFQSAEQFLAYERDDGIISCLVLDIRMPDMDGLALQRRLLVDDPELPIIFITGQEEEETVAPALAHGAIAVIPKPLDEEVLLNTIAKGFALQSGPDAKRHA
jgi:FixJ family two-component response regulator